MGRTRGPRGDPIGPADRYGYTLRRINPKPFGKIGKLTPCPVLLLRVVAALGVWGIARAAEAGVEMHNVCRTSWARDDFAYFSDNTDL